MPQPTISIVVCTYERPANLRRVLAAIEGQRGIAGAIEVIIADDGSRDETADVFMQFRRRVNFPVRFTTHQHTGFCPSRCRNEGVAASSGEYLILLDGDCLIPPDYLRRQLEGRRRGLVMIGDSLRLSEADSFRIDENLARRGGYEQFGCWQQQVYLWKKALKDSVYGLIGHPNKPHLFGNNVGMWREDYLRVNGFDENYVGWGFEDNDFGLRLRRAGITLRTMLWRTHPYHLWHPVETTCPVRIRQGLNQAYFSRKFRLTRTANGLTKRRAQDLRMQVVGSLPESNVRAKILPRWCRLKPQDLQHPGEVEVLFAPSPGQFSNRAECNLLIVPAGAVADRRQKRDAHLVLADKPFPPVRSIHQFKLHQFELALDHLLWNTIAATQQCASAA